jgi:hypothetical protein
MLARCLFKKFLDYLGSLPSKLCDTWVMVGHSLVDSVDPTTVYLSVLSVLLWSKEYHLT